MTLNKEATITISLADANALSIYAREAARAFERRGYIAIPQAARALSDELHELLIEAGYLGEVKTDEENA